MTITFFWNYLNHHQVAVADEMFKLLGGNFHFVATLPRNVNELKGGIDYSERSYCILAGEDKEAKKYAEKLSLESDACVFGACSQEYAVLRAKKNPSALSFEAGERWFKKGWINILSPVLCKWWFNYFHYFRKANFYKLCMGSFVKHDDELLGCYKGRHYKWGYFPSIMHLLEPSLNKKNIVPINKTIKVIWCGRFINWKHPELAIECARELKRAGYNFVLNMYGDGELRKSIETKTKDYQLDENVKFYGNVSNEIILKSMSESDIFLFTSDRREGWGAVVNEAMSQGCAIVAANCIGSIDYIVTDYVSGLKFASDDIQSLSEKVEWMIQYPIQLEEMKLKAYETIRDVWSPQHAVTNLLILISNLQQNRTPKILTGPCSKA